ncbi:hypothetical protein ZIOFF_063684 [Zingiber officinale]|uniref:Uncharacterized protein n=1 Tax=Zingiber officinale TaxID=94328 RepID=A0A8J5F6C6_ZINOF|nr:hypothetical protein ZIOFF_063684 [Zingiber officinale]
MATVAEHRRRVHFLSLRDTRCFVAVLSNTYFLFPEEEQWQEKGLTISHLFFVGDHPQTKEERATTSQRRLTSPFFLLLHSWLRSTFPFLFSPQREELEEVVLTEANFEKEVGQDRATLVEFYAPWWTVMNIRAYAASMECQDTQQFSGFLKGPWNQKKQSSLHMMHNKYEQSCRYEGPRATKALTEFKNTEGGTNVKLATIPSNIYEKLANAYKLEDDVVIANLDADKYKDLA